MLYYAVETALYMSKCVNYVYVYTQNKTNLGALSGFPEATIKQRTYDTENGSDWHVSNALLIFVTAEDTTVMCLPFECKKIEIIKSAL